MQHSLNFHSVQLVHFLAQLTKVNLSIVLCLFFAPSLLSGQQAPCHAFTYEEALKMTKPTLKKKNKLKRHGVIKS